MKGRFVFRFSLVLLLIVAPRISAHGIYVTARVERDMVVTESYFSRENKVIEGQIKIFGPNGEELLEGKTDANGIFSFKIPQVTDLRIVLESAMGHRAETVLKADEIRGNALRKIQKEKGPGFREIFLGLGVILALMGLTLYLRRIKRKSSTQKKDRFA